MVVVKADKSACRSFTISDITACAAYAPARVENVVVVIVFHFFCVDVLVYVCVSICKSKYTYILVYVCLDEWLCIERRKVKHFLSNNKLLFVKIINLVTNGNKYLLEM